MSTAGHGERRGVDSSSGYDRHDVRPDQGGASGQVLGEHRGVASGSGFAHQGDNVVRKSGSGTGSNHGESGGKASGSGSARHEGKMMKAAHGESRGLAPVSGSAHHGAASKARSVVPLEEMGADSGYNLDYLKRPDMQELMVSIEEARMVVKEDETPGSLVIKLPHCHNLLVDNNKVLVGAVEKLGHRVDAMEVGHNDLARYTSTACLVVSGKGLVQNNSRTGKTCDRATQSHVISVLDEKFGIHISRDDLATSHPLFIGSHVTAQRKRGRDADSSREPPLDKVIFRFVRFHTGSTYAKLLSWDGAHKSAQRKHKIYFDVKLSTQDQLISKVGFILTII